MSELTEYMKMDMARMEKEAKEVPKSKPEEPKKKAKK